MNFVLVVLLSIRFFIGTIFFLGAISKFANFSNFVGVVSNYQIVSKKFAFPVSLLVVFTEFICGVSLAFVENGIVVFLSIIFLLIVTGAVLFNLARGRRNIDCGCMLFSAAQQPLSYFLVGRNMVLMLALFFLLLFDSNLNGSLSWVNYLSVTFFSIFLIGLYATINQLFDNYSFLFSLKENG